MQEAHRYGKAQKGCVHNLGPQGEGMEGTPLPRIKGLNDAEFHL